MLATMPPTLSPSDWLTARLAADANPNVKDAAGNTCLHVAAQWCPHRVADILRTGADVSLRNHAGETALALAVSAGHPDAVRCLLEAASNPRSADVTGQTPIDRAETLGNRPEERAVRVLIAEVAARIDRGAAAWPSGKRAADASWCEALAVSEPKSVQPAPDRPSFANSGWAPSQTPRFRGAA